jgi:hypothetical protein
MIFMENNGGSMEAHPDYIAEKYLMVKTGKMFGWCDERNKLSIRIYCEKYGIDYDGLVKEMAHDYNHIPSAEYREKWGI